MKTQCENCSHNNVCSHKKHYEELVQTLKDMSQLAENGPFNITVHCRFYCNEKN